MGVRFSGVGLGKGLGGSTGAGFCLGELGKGRGGGSGSMMMFGGAAELLFGVWETAGLAAGVRSLWTGVEPTGCKGGKDEGAGVSIGLADGVMLAGNGLGAGGMV